MNKLLILFISVLLTELAIAVLILPEQYSVDSIIDESRSIERSFGAGIQEDILISTNAIYDEYIVDSGFRDGLTHLVIPTQAEKTSSRGMEKMGDQFFEFMQTRLNTTFNLIYLCIVRLLLLIEWMPLMLLILVPACWDGYMMHRIRRTDYSFQSAVKHHYSVALIGMFSIAIMCVLVFPLTLPHMIMPLSLATACALMGVVIQNQQKKL